MAELDDQLNKLLDEQSQQATPNFDCLSLIILLIIKVTTPTRIDKTINVEKFIESSPFLLYRIVDI